MARLRRGKALRMERMQTPAAAPTILRKLGRSVCDVGGAVFMDHKTNSYPGV
jgi:hypothetical protein